MPLTGIPSLTVAVLRIFCFLYVIALLGVILDDVASNENRWEAIYWTFAAAAGLFVCTTLPGVRQVWSCMNEPKQRPRDHLWECGVCEQRHNNKCNEIQKAKNRREEKESVCEAANQVETNGTSARCSFFGRNVPLDASLVLGSHAFSPVSSG
jgi:hypothetical protein